MPPSTDCSAATSCGGCRSYCGAVGVGRLKSSATATVVPPSTHRRTREQTPAEGPGPGGGSTRNDVRLTRTCVRVVATPGHRQFVPAGGAAEDVRKSGRTRPTPVCTPFCTTCGQVGGHRRVDMWRQRGTAGRRSAYPGRDLRGDDPRGVDGKNPGELRVSPLGVSPPPHSSPTSHASTGRRGARVTAPPGSRRPSIACPGAWTTTATTSAADSFRIVSGVPPARGLVAHLERHEYVTWTRRIELALPTERGTRSWPSPGVWCRTSTSRWPVSRARSACAHSGTTSTPSGARPPRNSPGERAGGWLVRG